MSCVGSAAEMTRARTNTITLPSFAAPSTSRVLRHVLRHVLHNVLLRILRRVLHVLVLYVTLKVGQRGGRHACVGHGFRRWEMAINDACHGVIAKIRSKRYRTQGGAVEKDGDRLTCLISSTDLLPVDAFGSHIKSLWGQRAEARRQTTARS